MRVLFRRVGCAVVGGGAAFGLNQQLAPPLWCFWGGSSGGGTGSAGDAAGRQQPGDADGSYVPPFPQNEENSLCWMEFAADDVPLGRVVFEVFDDTAPYLATNFKALCQGHFMGHIITDKSTNRKLNRRKAMWYQGTILHHVQPGFALQGGDNVNFDGSSGQSYNGQSHSDCFRGKGGRLPGPGCLMTVPLTKNINRSQFAVTLRAMPHLERRNSCIGQIVEGWEVVEAIEELGTASGRPRKEIQVTSCGILRHKSGLLFDEQDSLRVPLLESQRAELEKMRGAYSLPVAHRDSEVKAGLDKHYLNPYAEDIAPASFASQRTRLQDRHHTDLRQDPSAMG